MTHVRHQAGRLTWSDGTYKKSPAVTIAHELATIAAVGVIPCTAAGDHRRRGLRGEVPGTRLNTLFLNGVGLKRLSSRRRIAVSRGGVLAVDTPASRIARRPIPANSRIHHVHN